MHFPVVRLLSLPLFVWSEGSTQLLLRFARLRVVCVLGSAAKSSPVPSFNSAGHRVNMSFIDTASGFIGAVCLTYAGASFGAAGCVSTPRAEIASGPRNIALFALAGLPFDVVKLHMQTESGVGNSMLQTMRRLVARQGVWALWSGAMPALASASIENSVVFTANGFFRRTLAGGAPEDSLSLPQHALIGGLSGVFSATAICPAEVVKCRMQYSVGSTPLQCIRAVLSEAGLKGLFHGLGPLLARDVPFNTLFFGSYRSYCAAAGSLRGLWSGGQSAQHHELSGAEYFLCGGFAGMTAWSIIFPFDCVKSRVQSGAASGSAVNVASAMWRAEGIRAFYKGWSAAVLRGFPANAALLLGVELSAQFMRELFAEPV